jgi:hypothetical protein
MSKLYASERELIESKAVSKVEIQQLKLSIEERVKELEDFRTMYARAFVLWGKAKEMENFEKDDFF